MQKFIIIVISIYILHIIYLGKIIKNYKLKNSSKSNAEAIERLLKKISNNNDTNSL